MKLNWGSGIAIFYVCFMAIMIFMVIKSKQNTVHLVQENYYQKDLDYEQFRAKRQNASALTESIQIQYNSSKQSVTIVFPEQMKTSTGKLTFFRPSNKYMDKIFKLELDKQGSMLIPINPKTIPSGKWNIQVDWESEGKLYYKETTVVI